jgi:glyoxalase family protein
VHERASETRYALGDGGPGALLHVRNVAGFWQGTTGVGTVHHVAWRTPDDQQAQAWHATLSTAGFAVTPLADRRYFQSIYVREPGGVIFEIATDGPGVTVDEPLEHLGAVVQPPPGTEPEWQALARTLPPRVPGGEQEASQDAEG